jgi:hypothetical protein
MCWQREGWALLAWGGGVWREEDSTPPTCVLRGVRAINPIKLLLRNVSADATDVTDERKP